jgi:2-oxoglutarate dehydrogenase E2 component (dihydrolipoamide succinyltransferase)
MAVELKVPQVGESIQEVQVGKWLKSEGDAVERDQAVVELESDKATVELPAPSSGTVSRVLKKEGETAAVGEVIGYIEESDGAAARPAAKAAQTDGKAPAPEEAPEEPVLAGRPEAVLAKISEPDPDLRTAERDAAAAAEAEGSGEPAGPATTVMPAARRALAEHHLRPEEVEATGPGGRLLKEDVLREAEARKAAPAAAAAPAAPARQVVAEEDGREEEIVPMSPLRRRIAERLVSAQQNAALLTTFNEIDMSGVMELREQYKEAFQQKHEVKLGFMSFFVRASIEALKEFPAINAYIQDEEIVYHRYYDIGIAIGSGKGLIVPVLRNAERMTFAEIEKAIADLGARAKDNKIKPDELQGGTFSISNGGIYGSLLSTPIVNPPQSGILGMHAIQDRPVARDGQVIIRPMMYVALTYDHRIVDGREAVTFLRRIKEFVESPARMLLEV